MSNLRKYLWISAFAAASVIPVAAQQYPSTEQQDRQDQVRHDSDDQNRINQDQDQVRRDQDNANRQDRDRQAIQNDQDQDRDRNGAYNTTDRDRDRDRNGAYNNGTYVGENSQWVNTKAYQEGLKDGQHDRTKKKSQRAHEHRWKNDNDRQAYSAGYDNGYRGNMRNDHDRDDQYRNR